MIYAAMFAAALCFGWFAAFRWGGRAERESVCLLSCVWLATVLSNLMSGYASPAIVYAMIDGYAMWFLYYHQRRNWQWLLQGLFTVMMTVHLVHLVGVEVGLSVSSGRPYQDFLAFLGYAQIASLSWASWQRRSVRDGRGNHLAVWAFGNDWVPSRSVVNRSHAGT